MHKYEKLVNESTQPELLQKGLLLKIIEGEKYSQDKGKIP